ncbi:hypothetical protein LOTGIDRAFT_133209 [Lottia gigantea]|uniref:Neuroendocrine protein 7B2 n=1 Tax=Lottia gigantea TaxID=225164 RepID=V3ZM37_LOTGI|nr:hypothetical protein LOTGIDRAFT_133209 [Lottia gigantea]ESO83500.1 hypothetical protein LOTGIDRAFT_133209 [Lottia gigantea]
MNIFIMACVAIGVAVADMSFPSGYDTYLDLARMYRMKELANLYDTYRDNDDLESRSVDDDEWLQGNGYDEGYKGEPYTGTNLRDQEHLEQSSLYGYQSMSGKFFGGNDGGKQKSDKSLPAYCNPPNPCPIGKTAKDNCLEGFVNSAENNKKLLDEQECPCDTEHMFSCPAGGNTVSSKSQGDAVAINKVMDELQKLDDDLVGENYSDIVVVHNKRVAVVAKKSPHMIKKRESKFRDVKNPYLHGQQLKNIAKKSGTNPY